MIVPALFPENATLQTHLRHLTVTREEWDDNRGGGHLWFEDSSSAPMLTSDTVDVFTEDADGTDIEIILHVVDGRIAWGEWYRVDSAAILRWPPASVRREW
jgi:hypothetical protein